VKRFELIQAIFNNQLPREPRQVTATAFAPINVALCKYWGKRNNELNLPVTSSLSIAVPTKGTTTTLLWAPEQTQDNIIFNGKEMDPKSSFVQGITQFLDLFRPQHKWYLQATIKMNIALAAGFASSSCGFAALSLALNNLFTWNLEPYKLSILARLGSGSAARSLWTGFVEWHRGTRDDGMDSHASPLAEDWPALCIGLLSVCETEKPISSRKAMQHTVNTSHLYPYWPEKVAQDLVKIKYAIDKRDFSLLGKLAEQNALAMHATMLSSQPPICYFLSDTIAAIRRIWTLRKAGLELYFTQDAGPNLKLLFLKKDITAIQKFFPSVEIVSVFSGCI
jgi:diphosphomevalonate decarboxylase